MTMSRRHRAHSFCFHCQKFLQKLFLSILNNTVGKYQFPDTCCTLVPCSANFYPGSQVTFTLKGRFSYELRGAISQKMTIIGTSVSIRRTQIVDRRCKVKTKLLSANFLYQVVKTVVLCQQITPVLGKERKMV